MVLSSSYCIWHLRLGLASQIGPGTPDFIQHARLALTFRSSLGPPDWPWHLLDWAWHPGLTWHHELALAPWLAPGI